jgi:predicted LPLAT superfamily acyltransferase
MAQWSGASKGTSFGYQIFIFTMKVFGLRAGYFILYLVAFYYFLFSNTNGAMMDYFRLSLGYSYWKSQKSLYQNYYLLGQTILDRFAAMAGMASQFNINHHDTHYLKEIDDQGTGAMLLSAHIGNYEIAGYFLKKMKTPVNIVMYDGENKNIKEAVKKGGVERSVHVIFIKNDMSHIIEIANRMMNKEIIIMHGDRYKDGMKFIETELMSRKAKLPLGPFQIISKFPEVPVAFVYGFKTSAFDYDFYCSKPLYFNKNDISEIVKSYTESMEEKINKYPLQWFNYFYFWHS